MKIETPYKKENVISFKRKGKLIAYISFRRVGKPKHKLFELTKIDVSKKYRRISLATRLFNNMIKKIKPRKLFVTTHASNKKARKFYRSVGMKLETTFHDHYYEGEDEMIYTRYF